MTTVMTLSMACDGRPAPTAAKPASGERMWYKDRCVVRVAQSAQLSLQKDALARFESVVQKLTGVSHKRAQPPGKTQKVVGDFIGVQWP